MSNLWTGRRLCLVVLVSLAIGSASDRADAQCCCFWPVPTLRERWNDADVIAIARRIKSIPTHQSKLALSIYEVESVERNKTDCSIQKGDRFVRHEFQADIETERIIFVVRPVVVDEGEDLEVAAQEAADDDEVEGFWNEEADDDPAEDEAEVEMVAVERAAFEEEEPLSLREPNHFSWQTLCGFTPGRLKFLSDAPSAGTAQKETLKYFAAHIGSDDALLADEAFRELDKCQDSAAAGMIPRETLRRLLRDPGASSSKVRMFSLLLGMDGEPSDAEWLEKQILERMDERLDALYGLMAGYLCMTKEEGLAKLSASVFDRKGEAGEHSRQAFISAVRFFQTDSGKRIPAERLRQTLHRAIDYPDMADEAIDALTEMRDWSVLPRLARLVDDPKYDDHSVRYEMAHFCRASLREFPVDPREAVLIRIEQSRALLTKLLEKHPELEE